MGPIFKGQAVPENCLACLQNLEADRILSAVVNKCVEDLSSGTRTNQVRLNEYTLVSARFAWVDWKCLRLWRMFYQFHKFKSLVFLPLLSVRSGAKLANSTVNTLQTGRLNGRPWLFLTRGITSTLHVFFLSVPIMQHNAHKRFRILFSVSPLSASLPCRFLINPLNAELNSISHLLALLGIHHILHVSWIRVKPSVSSTLFTWNFHCQACWKNCEKRLSAHPHGTTRLTLLGFSWNLIFDYFSKICRENSSFIKIGQD
jgi:hypothetical protein